MSADSGAAADPRIMEVQQFVAQLVAGNWSARATLSGDDDVFDHILSDLNQLATMLAADQAAHEEAERHADEIIDVMMGVASLDYSRRAPVGDDDSVFDAIAGGLNMLIDELIAAQEAGLQLQADVIQAQDAALRELSTPLIPINDTVVVMPLIGAIDSQRADQIMESLLTGILETRATIAIIDITGVSVVDSQVANALVRSARAVTLLGAQVVLTGIRPEVAQALVGLGIDLRNIITRSTLQAGIAYALHR